jgi:hypothetical protein
VGRLAVLTKGAATPADSCEMGRHFPRRSRKTAEVAAAGSPGSRRPATTEMTQTGHRQSFVRGLASKQMAKHDEGEKRHLVCAECEAESDDAARGWRALQSEENEVVTYCPKCAAREFDDDV